MYKKHTHEVQNSYMITRKPIVVMYKKSTNQSQEFIHDHKEPFVDM